ncbi:hypothetical protein [Streptomyces violens]|uniref:hypothetical protein n=1 Tax=Streptomyces violens TaxID=66377 RepID=UPI0004C2187A|nr:hypothetical protein [Streptomyces violens]
MLTIDLALLLAVILFLVMRRPPAPRKRIDQVLVVFAAVAFGVLIATTPLGQGILDFLGELTRGVSQAAS